MKTSFVAGLLLASSQVNAVDRMSAEIDTPCFSYAETSLSVTTRSVYDEDTGKNSWRVQFNYVGLIQSDDEVHFYLSFVPTTLLTTRDVQVIAEDIGHCSATVNTANPIFWTVEALDTYATCTPVNAATDVANCITQAPSSYQATSEATSENNWTVAIQDEDPDDRFCTRPDDYTTDQTYACTAFKCPIQRLFDTEDGAKDMIITTGTVTVYQNRCWAQIGSSSSFVNAGPVALGTTTITIANNAIMSAVGLVAASTFLMSF